MDKTEKDGEQISYINNNEYNKRKPVVVDFFFKEKKSERGIVEISSGKEK